MSKTIKDNKKLSLVVRPTRDEQDLNESITNIEVLITNCIAEMVASIPPENLTKDPRKFDELARVTAVLIQEVEKYVRSKYEAAKLAKAKELKALKKLDKNSQPIKENVVLALENIQPDAEKTAKKPKNRLRKARL